MKTCAISAGLPMLLAVGGFLLVASLDHHRSRAQSSPAAPDNDVALKAAGQDEGRPTFAVTLKRPRPTLANTPAKTRYEPSHGVYLGAALDLSHLGQGGTRAGEFAALMRQWEKESERKHAIYSQFVSFPQEDGKFPAWDSDPHGWPTIADFCDATTALHATPLITLEPQLPLPFADDWHEGSAAYDATVSLARSAGKWGRPIFIRFAHEMNGSWYPWAEWIDRNRNLRRDPDEDTGFTAAHYRRAYRNVAAMFRQYAPNAALVWCPNSGLLSGPRRDVFRPFYPGDDVVDWVGLDIYERGWSLPMPGAHLWGGQFGHNLHFDAADNPDTEANESVDFYQTFAAGKRKPLMICETAATLSYRNDLPGDERARLNHQWKAGFWNTHEYGWMQSVYGTSYYHRQSVLQPLDLAFPQIKAIIWFQLAKREYIPAQKRTAGERQIVWFENQWADYRIGGGIAENQSSQFAAKEISIYRDLTANPWFLSSVK